MRCKTRLMLMIGCVGLLSLNTPAMSRPSPRGLETAPRTEANRAAAQVRHARKLRHAARLPQRRVVRPIAAGARPDQRYPVAAPMPVTSMRARPMFGWPALVTEARKYIGTNPTARDRLWCATFMNFVLAKVGYSGTGSDAAKSFASYGQRISEPKVGAIAVLTRGRRGGHVGIVTGLDAGGNPIIISGNHGHRVGEAAYSRNRVIAYVMPTGRPQPTQIALASQMTPVRASDADNDSGISSPIAELLAAINAESPPAERRPPPAAPAPPVPQRTVQQMPQASPAPYRVVQQMPQAPQAVRRDLPLDPALARMFGRSDRDGIRPAPRTPQPQHAAVRAAATDMSAVRRPPQPR